MGVSKEARARRDFKVEGATPSESINVKKGDVGELLSGVRTKEGYTVIINDKTLTIKEKRVLLHLFKI